MKKLLTLLTLSLIVVATSGCPEQKFPQGKQVPPKEASKEAPEKAPEEAPEEASEEAKE